MPVPCSVQPWHRGGQGRTRVPLLTQYIRQAMHPPPPATPTGLSVNSWHCGGRDWVCASDVRAWWGGFGVARVHHAGCHLRGGGLSGMPLIRGCGVARVGGGCGRGSGGYRGAGRGCSRAPPMGRRWWREPGCWPPPPQSLSGRRGARTRHDARPPATPARVAPAAHRRHHG